MIVLQDFILDENASLKEALAKIDKNAKGTCFIVNNSNQLIGILTDGDIRRRILDGSSVSMVVKKVMNREFVALPASVDNNTILQSLSDKIKVIPLIDENDVIVDYATISRIRRIPIANPVFDGNELNYISECIQTSWISSQGKYVNKFEELFSAYTGMPSALATSSGTTALHLALASLNIKEGDEVIVPDLTFAATINAVIYTGATPVIADVDPITWTISTKSIENLLSPKTRAIIPVHLYGHPCNMDDISTVCKELELFIVEDCAESLGSEYKGQPTGSFGHASIFSFFGNKTITTGEGGMVVFRDKETGKYGEKLRDHGMSKNKKYWHDVIGYNYRMTNLQAAIGVAQMERLNKILERKFQIAAWYDEAFQGMDNIKLPSNMAWSRNSYWLYTILINDADGQQRDHIIEYCYANGVETRPVFYPLHRMTPYAGYKKDQLQNSMRISESGISLPSSIDLTFDEIERIAQTIKSGIEKTIQ